MSNPINHSKKTIAEAGRVWLQKCELAGRERATLRSYEGHLRLYIEPKIGSIVLQDLTSAMVVDFYESVIIEKSHATAKKVLCSLKAIISEVQRRDWVLKNVARTVPAYNSRKQKHKRVMPTKDEIRLLLTTVNKKHEPLIMTAIFTGMRASELRGLIWEYVDLEKGLIHVKQRADRFNEIGEPKSDSGYRSIPLTPNLVKTLKVWKMKCPTGEYDLVFPNGKGNIETHSNIYNRVFKPLMVECGLLDSEGKPLFGIHAMRHAAASLMIDQGWLPKRIQTIMGHSSINMTFDVYGHLFDDPEADVEAMAKLESDLLAA